MKPIIRRNNAKHNRSTAEVKYEKLLSQLQEQQQYNNNLQSSLQTVQAKVTAELEPLTKRYYALLRKLLIAIDAAANKSVVGKHNKELLDVYMAETSRFLLKRFGYQDTQLAALLFKYGNINADDVVRHYEEQFTSAKFSQVYGFNINFKEMVEKGEENYFTENRHHFTKAGQTQATAVIESELVQDWSEDNKTAARKEADNKLLHSDARSVYMRLIKKFHPDLERDEDKQNQNTEIVKEVTKAYQEKDFFTLLKLQIKYLDDNETEATNIADAMLKRYNKILQKQLAELKQNIQIQHYTSGNTIENFIDNYGNFSPQKFATQRNFLKKRNNALTSEIETSTKSPEIWLNGYLHLLKLSQDK
ncbi:hypothetical protein [Mucilaginibacter aquatilis]|uniref:J domain-containing protein n=1 Tax=Mucilaginibacter aquatilis TaxID=1517760 RepID=A0A6I4IR34_9SPHI|nr:hypothetical protein [Mucilaginibacter aquatilis]MVN92843.1 hypothetical protein [Mucilaginibacter aquatilis]